MQHSNGITKPTAMVVSHIYVSLVPFFRKMKICFHRCFIGIAPFIFFRSDCYANRMYGVHEKLRLLRSQYRGDGNVCCV